MELENTSWHNSTRWIKALVALLRHGSCHGCVANQGVTGNGTSVDAHERSLVTFQRRILVFIQWAIENLTFNHGSRLITGVAPTDFDFNKGLSELRSASKTKAKTQSATAHSLRATF